MKGLKERRALLAMKGHCYFGWFSDMLYVDIPHNHLVVKHHFDTHQNVKNNHYHNRSPLYHAYLIQTIAMQTRNMQAIQGWKKPPTE